MDRLRMVHAVYTRESTDYVHMDPSSNQEVFTILPPYYDLEITQICELMVTISGLVTSHLENRGARC